MKTSYFVLFAVKYDLSQDFEHNFIDEKDSLNENQKSRKVKIKSKKTKLKLS